MPACRACGKTLCLFSTLSLGGRTFSPKDLRICLYCRCHFRTAKLLTPCHPGGTRFLCRRTYVFCFQLPDISCGTVDLGCEMLLPKPHCRRFCTWWGVEGVPERRYAREVNPCVRAGNTGVGAQSKGMMSQFWKSTRSAGSV